MKPPVFRMLSMALAAAAVALSAPAEAPAPSESAPALSAEAPATADAPLAGPDAVEQQFWQEDYGDCILWCGDWEPYSVYFQTYDQCCNTFHLCPDSSYPVSKHWSPYYGWPLLCQT